MDFARLMVDALRRDGADISFVHADDTITAALDVRPPNPLFHSLSPTLMHSLLLLFSHCSPVLPPWLTPVLVGHLSARCVLGARVRQGAGSVCRTCGLGGLGGAFVGPLQGPSWCENSLGVGWRGIRSIQERIDLHSPNLLQWENWRRNGQKSKQFQSYGPNSHHPRSDRSTQRRHQKARITITININISLQLPLAYRANKH